MKFGNTHKTLNRNAYILFRMSRCSCNHCNIMQIIATYEVPLRHAMANTASSEKFMSTRTSFWTEPQETVKGIERLLLSCFTRQNSGLWCRSGRTATTLAWRSGTACTACLSDEPRKRHAVGAPVRDDAAMDDADVLPHRLRHVKVGGARSGLKYHWCGTDIFNILVLSASAHITYIDKKNHKFEFHC